MPHSQSWLSQNQVVYVTFSGAMSSQDIGDAFHESAVHVIESSDPPVHFLHNWQEVERFPSSLSQVVKASQDTKAPLRKVGWVVAYGKHGRLFEFMGNIFFQLFNVRFKLVKTFDDALDFLCKHDGRLDKETLVQAHQNLNSPSPLNISDDSSTKPIDTPLEKDMIDDTLDHTQPDMPPDEETSTANDS